MAAHQIAPALAATLGAVAATLGDDERAVVNQLAQADTAVLRLFWQRRRVEIQLARLQRGRHHQVQLWLPRDEAGCERCRAMHGKVVPVDAPVEHIVHGDCSQLAHRLCPLQVSGWIDQRLLKTPLAD